MVDRKVEWADLTCIINAIDPSLENSGHDSVIFFLHQHLWDSYFVVLV